MSGAAFGIGYKCLKRFCEEQNALKFHRAKLIPEMFKPGEQEVLAWVTSHVVKHHELPKPETLYSVFSDLQQYPTPEPSSYYLEHVENRLYYDRINNANIESQKLLQADKTDYRKAMDVLSNALGFISGQRYRQKIVDVAKEGPKMVMDAYHHINSQNLAGTFGWPHMDKDNGGMMPGDLISIVGKTASGKTFMVLRTALHNWGQGHRPLVVSMEMSPLPLIQRATSMYAHTNIAQLKAGAYSGQTYNKFQASMFTMAGGPSGLYVVDGNLAASVDDIYTLAVQLKCDQIYIDGAYLLKHPNFRLGKYERVSENTELIKQRTTDLEAPTFASYQFAKTATKAKSYKGGQAKPEEATLDDIGLSISISQLSSIVFGMFQDDGVETLERRKIRVMKGRGGETGAFDIFWDFHKMNFDQCDVDTLEGSNQQLMYI